MPEPEEVLRAAYRAFNSRDIDAALGLMHPDVDWPNAWEGGRVQGGEAVKKYWLRQFAAMSSRVEPQAFSLQRDGSILVDAHQEVHDAASGKLISTSDIKHRFHFAGGLIIRMDVVERELG
jgi:ketosteroid isomerase-like protein